MASYALVGIALLSTAFGQAPRTAAIKLAPIYSSPAARLATEDLTSKRKTVIQAQQYLEKVTAQANTSPSAAPDPVVVEAQKKVDAAAAEAKEAASKVLAKPESRPAPADKVRELKDTVSQFKLQASQDAKASGNTFLALTLAGILLALGASVTGFLQKGVLAGVLSLSAAAVGGVPKALAVDETADYYRALYQGASSLAFDLQLDLVITEDDYNEYLRRLQVLVNRSAPNAVKSREAATELITELQAAKTPHRD